MSVPYLFEKNGGNFQELCFYFFSAFVVTVENIASFFFLFFILTR